MSIASNIIIITFTFKKKLIIICFQSKNNLADKRDSLKIVLRGLSIKEQRF